MLTLLPCESANMNTREIYMTIGELAQMAGVTVRTVRFYVAGGVLPPGVKRGRKRVYTDEHLDRLRLILLMKKQFLPLREIRRRIAAMSIEEVRKMLLDNTEDDPRVLREVGPHYVRSEDPATYGSPEIWRRERAPKQTEPVTWQRVELARGVELSYRQPETFQEHEAIQDIVRFGRERIMNIE